MQTSRGSSPPLGGHRRGRGGGATDTTSTPKRRRGGDVVGSAEEARAGEVRMDTWGQYMTIKKTKLAVQGRMIRNGLTTTSTLFAGKAFWVNGWTDPPQNELREMILQHGGEFHYFKESHITHVIATELAATKVHELRPSDTIVHPSWILDSIAAGSCVSETPYLVYSHVSELGGQSSITSFLGTSSSSTAPALPTTSSASTATTATTISAAPTATTTTRSRVHLSGATAASPTTPSGRVKSGPVPGREEYQHTPAPTAESPCGQSPTPVVQAAPARASPVPVDGLPCVETTSSSSHTSSTPIVRLPKPIVLPSKETTTKSDCVSSSSSSLAASARVGDPQHQHAAATTTATTTVTTTRVTKRSSPHSPVVLSPRRPAFRFASKPDTPNTLEHHHPPPPPHGSASPQRRVRIVPLPSVGDGDSDGDAVQGGAVGTSMQSTASPTTTVLPKPIPTAAPSAASATVAPSAADPTAHTSTAAVASADATASTATSRIATTSLPLPPGVPLRPKRSTRRAIAAPTRASTSPQKALPPTATAAPPQAERSWDEEAWRRKHTAVSPSFLAQYFAQSRLHHLSTWKSELAERLAKRILRELEAASSQASPWKPSDNVVRRCQGPGGHRGGPASASPTSPASSPKSPSSSSPGTTPLPIVLHVDMDCFFASVAERENPQLRGKPVGVSHATSMEGSADVAAVNYAARKLGVKNGMRLSTARQLCPGLVLVPYQFPLYERVSEQLYEVFLRFTRRIQVISCDEAFLDCTGLGHPEAIARAIRDDVWAATGCRASAGVAHNQLLARMATRSAKPNGQFWLQPDAVPAYMQTQPVRNLPAVGWRTDRKMRTLGIHTCGQLLQKSEAWLQGQFGASLGTKLWSYCRGLWAKSVKPGGLRKQIGVDVNWGIRFKAGDEVRHFLRRLSTELCNRLKGRRGRSITLKIMKRSASAPLYPSKFLGHGRCDTYSRSVTLPTATGDPNVLCTHVWDLYCHMEAQLRMQPNDLRGVGMQLARLDTKGVDPGSESVHGSATSAAASAGTPAIDTFLRGMASPAAPADAERSHRRRGGRGGGRSSSPPLAFRPLRRAGTGQHAAPLTTHAHAASSPYTTATSTTTATTTATRPSGNVPTEHDDPYFWQAQQPGALTGGNDTVKNMFARLGGKSPPGKVAGGVPQNASSAGQRTRVQPTHVRRSSDGESIVVPDTSSGGGSVTAPSPAAGAVASSAQHAVVVEEEVPMPDASEIDLSVWNQLPHSARVEVASSMRLQQLRARRLRPQRTATAPSKQQPKSRKVAARRGRKRRTAPSRRRRSGSASGSTTPTVLRGLQRRKQSKRATASFDDLDLETVAELAPAEVERVLRTCGIDLNIVPDAASTNVVSLDDSLVLVGARMRCEEAPQHDDVDGVSRGESHGDGDTVGVPAVAMEDSDAPPLVLLRWASVCHDFLAWLRTVDLRLDPHAQAGGLSHSQGQGATHAEQTEEDDEEAEEDEEVRQEKRCDKDQVMDPFAHHGMEDSESTQPQCPPSDEGSAAVVVLTIASHSSQDSEASSDDPPSEHIVAYARQLVAQGHVDDVWCLLRCVRRVALSHSTVSWLRLFNWILQQIQPMIQTLLGSDLAVQAIPIDTASMCAE